MEELDAFMNHFRVAFCVIDANPERRKALEFAQRFPDRVKLCYYASGISQKVINSSDNTNIVNVDRTVWMDLAYGRVKRRKMRLPRNLSHDYKEHLKAPVRIYDRDNRGNPLGKYSSGRDDDHYAHCRVYCEIALTFAAGKGVSKNISGGV
jgi:hypothetical protein